jgi:hypothetical protein
MKGTKKCNIKNKPRVPLLTENPAQIQTTKVGPRYGITLIKLVITTAAQNLICPQTRT